MSICAYVNIMHIYQIKYLWPCLVSNMKQVFKSSRYHQCHPFPLSFQQSISSYCGAHPDPFYVTVIQWFISRQCYTQLLRIVTAFIQLNRRVSNIIILFKICALIFLPTKQLFATFIPYFGENYVLFTSCIMRLIPSRGASG